MFDRVKQLVSRIYNSGVKDPSQWLVDWVRQGDPAASGEAVNEVSALGLAAYIACIRNISEDTAKLPLWIYERMEPRGRKSLYEHDVSQLLYAGTPNDEMSPMSFRETITSHALGWHGGFAEIVRDGTGRPRALWPLDPTCVQRKRQDYAPRSLYYLVHGIPFPKENIFDLHGLGYDGISGYVLARLAKDPIGNALAAQKFAGSYFANGTVSSGVIKVPDAMTDTAFKHLRESFFQRHGGGQNQHKPIILEQGADWTPTSVAAKDSQMIEVLQNGVEEVCRLFRMPPHKIQHLLRATFTNIEMQALEYVVDTLLGWAVRWEQEIQRKLLVPSERRRRFAKHNFNMLMRGDSAARATFYREMMNIGVLSENDIREYEDLNPIEGGDTYYVNAAMVPIDLASTGKHLSTMQPKPEPAAPAQPAPPDTSSSKAHRMELIGRVAAAHEKIIADRLGAVLKLEHDRIRGAQKRPGFDAWVDGFYKGTHPEHLKREIGPPIEALSASVNAILYGDHSNV